MIDLSIFATIPERTDDEKLELFEELEHDLLIDAKTRAQMELKKRTTNADLMKFKDVYEQRLQEIKDFVGLDPLKTIHYLKKPTMSSKNTQ